MPGLSTIGLFALAALALWVIPGPSVMYVVTRSVQQGRNSRPRRQWSGVVLIGLGLVAATTRRPAPAS